MGIINSFEKARFGEARKLDGATQKAKELTLSPEAGRGACTMGVGLGESVVVLLFLVLLLLLLFILLLLLNTTHTEI